MGNILKRWLTVEDFTNEFGMSKDTQVKKRASGVLPYSKLGGFIYYDRYKIDKLLEEHHIGA